MFAFCRWVDNESGNHNTCGFILGIRPWNDAMSWDKRAKEMLILFEFFEPERLHVGDSSI